jgi:hypothetical protein
VVYKIAAAFRSLGDPTFTGTEKREASIKKKEKNGIGIISLSLSLYRFKKRKLPARDPYIAMGP